MSLVKCPMLQVEKEILADIEEDFALKSKCREFREKLAKRADRKKERQEEKEKQQNLTYKMIWGGKTYMDNGQILVKLRLVKSERLIRRKAGGFGFLLDIHEFEWNDDPG